jgi:ubiquinone biosynthesis monooxygenase Coq7
MRVNHAGEISAQGLYRGQAATAQLASVREKMEDAAQEEYDHLAWCKRRLSELDSHPSLLAPLWYTGSFAMGAIAGAAGDKWSLGFLAETERQVVKHLEGHFDKLPAEDGRSRVILEQMQRDEAAHAQTAVDAGAKELPQPLKKMMTLVARVMTSTAYRI